MNVDEISDRFDYAMQKQLAGPALDEYNKSLYLTKAQLAFVRNTLKVYEYTDELRHIIAPLLITVDEPALSFTFGPKYAALTIPTNSIMEIVYEEINGGLPTIPMDLNDIHYTVDNPFRKPDVNIAYRTTVGDELRIYTSESLINYLYIYCQYPNPIVLEDFTGLGIDISGVVIPTTSQLSDDVVMQIIDTAVTMAIKDLRTLLAPTEAKSEEQK